MSRLITPARQWTALAIVLALTAGALVLVWRHSEEPTINRAVAKLGTQMSAPPRDVIAPGALLATEFPDLDGKPVPLGKWQGKIIVLNFWATWCGPCREEMPTLVRLQEKYRDRGVVFIGLAVDEKDKVAEYLRQVPVNYPILIGDLDAMQFAARTGNVQGGLPYTALIDRSGKIIATKIGILNESALENQLALLL